MLNDFLYLNDTIKSQYFNSKGIFMIFDVPSYLYRNFPNNDKNINMQNRIDHCMFIN